MKHLRNFKHQEIYNKLSHILSKYPREYYVVGFFGLIFLIIIQTLFSFTVLNHDYYKNLADQQQTSKIKTPTTRGAIYSANEKGNVLAVGVDLNDLAIDPKVEGNKPKLGVFLTDIVYNEICYLKSALDCKKGLNRFLGTLEIPDFRMNENYLKEKISARVVEKITRNKVTSVLLKDTLTTEQSFELEKMNLAGVYVNGANLYVNPEEILDKDFVAQKIVGVTGESFEDIKHSLRKRDLRYSLILNKLSISTSENIKQKIDEEKQAFARGYLKKEEMIGGFMILTPNPHRFYPEKSLASQVLGYVNNEGEGNYGIEGYFNRIIKGKQTQTFSKKDTMGRQIDPFSFEAETSDLRGADVTLTIDRNIQKAVEEIIDKDVVEFKANKISVVVMNPKTGAIMAMASNPRFDPNNPGEAYELEKVNYAKFPNPSVDLLGARVLAVDNRNGKEFIYDGKKVFLREISREEYADPKLDRYVFVNRQGGGVYRNETIQDLYEPGSVMKSITMAIGIDTGEISPYDYYKDDGFVMIDKFKIKNSTSKCLGYNTFLHALDFSCNVGMIRISQKIGASLFHKYLESFGFGKPTGITLDGEITGRLDSYERWSQAQLFTTSFGQGISATMIQMAAAYSVLANGGIYVKPQIVKEIAFPDGKTIVYKKEETHRVIKESTSKVMIDLLVHGVDHGYAKTAGVPGYKVAGKTGTSQIAYKGKYEDINGIGTKIGSFGGFAPAEDPKFVIIVKVDRPRIVGDGGSATAAVTFGKISQYLFNYFAIPKK